MPNPIQLVECPRCHFINEVDELIDLTQIAIDCENCPSIIEPDEIPTDVEI